MKQIERRWAENSLIVGDDGRFDVKGKLMRTCGGKGKKTQLVDVVDDDDTIDLIIKICDVLLFLKLYNEKVAAAVYVYIITRCSSSYLTAFDDDK